MVVVDGEDSQFVIDLKIVRPKAADDEVGTAARVLARAQEPVIDFTRDRRRLGKQGRLEKVIRACPTALRTTRRER